MLHLYDQPRAPVDRFEYALVNGLAGKPGIDALWVREIASPGSERRTTKLIYVTLARASRGLSREVEEALAELGRRASIEPFGVELHFLIDDLPPAAVAPSCIWRRHAIAR